VNYAGVTEITRGDDGFINGVVAVDGESGGRFTAPAHVVVNATGMFTDEIRRLDEPDAPTMVAPSQGIHLVFERSFLRGETAIMVPHTSDGRVMFAIPWHEHTLVGTTDTPIDAPSYDPLPFEKEIDFVLETASLYLSRPPKRSDILSVYTGIRPLVKADGAAKTSALSRDHTIHVDGSGLLSIVGGKWTTYRRMAQDCVDHAITLGSLPDTECRTHHLKIHGYDADVDSLSGMGVYGSDADAIRKLADDDPELAKTLHPALPYIAAEVVWAVRHEMARTLDDVLARRVRALFLNSGAAIEMAPAVAALMARELKQDDAWINAHLAAFLAVAARYQPDSALKQ
jgi:glycerol-3-phosphate dehydrogenase